MDNFLAEIRIFGGTFAPRGWALCQGQILAIAQNTALFSLLGTTYGGNGQTTFALPDLRGRIPLGFGQGPGLSNYDQGQVGGTESVTLLANQLPPHSHPLLASTAAGAASAPTNNALAVVTDPTANPMMGYVNATPASQMHASSIGANTGSQGHPNVQPYLCLNFIIALEGIFPARN